MSTCSPQKCFVAKQLLNWPTSSHNREGSRWTIVYTQVFSKDIIFFISLPFLWWFENVMPNHTNHGAFSGSNVIITEQSGCCDKSVVAFAHWMPTAGRYNSQGDSNPPPPIEDQKSEKLGHCFKSMVPLSWLNVCCISIGYRTVWPRLSISLKMCLNVLTSSNKYYYYCPCYGAKLKSNSWLWLGLFVYGKY